MGLVENKELNMHYIYPSLMGADLDHLDEVIKQFNPHMHKGFHIDVMDGKFVPRALFHPEDVNAISQASTHPCWVHLMVQQPEKWVNYLNLMPGSIVSFHHEAIGASNSLIDTIHGNNWKASVAINPETNIEHIFPILENIEQVLLMSVEPGLAGQEFLKPVADKITPLAAYRNTNKLSFRIGIDGGINADNIVMLAQKGADDFAVASAIFDAQNPIAAFEALQKLIA